MAAILAPEWVDLCRLLEVVLRACRPYRAKTKGKVERMVREVKESLLPWLSGRPHGRSRRCPTTTCWAEFGSRRSCWYGAAGPPDGLIGEASDQERERLRSIPERLLNRIDGDDKVLVLPAAPPQVPLRRLGEEVEMRDLTEYEELAR